MGDEKIFCSDCMKVFNSNFTSLKSSPKIFNISISFSKLITSTYLNPVIKEFIFHKINNEKSMYAS